MGERTIATVTKQDLVDRIAERFRFKKQDTRRIVQGFLDEVIDELREGNRLEFREFGVFEIKQRAPRKARNPQTGDTVTVPAREVVHFKAGRRLRDNAERVLEGSEAKAIQASLERSRSNRVARTNGAH